MPLTPPLPTTIQGSMPHELVSLSEEVWMKSAKLSSIYSPHVLNSIKELLRKVNSYYSNRLESEGTHPVDIERAMRKDFDIDEKKRNLQQLSLAYIETQTQIEKQCKKKSFEPFSKEFTLWVHETLYSKKEMNIFCNIPTNQEGTSSVIMTPGKLREDDVAVGNHTAPLHQELSSLFATYESFYNKDFTKLTQAHKLIYAIMAHHKLTWLHPFLDGNGRVGRMIIPLFLKQTGLIQRPMFYISAFFEANREEYYDRLLAVSRDGNWTGWCAFFLKAVRMQAEQNFQKAQAVLDLYNQMKLTIAEISHSQFSIHVLDWIFEHPIFNGASFSNASGIPKATAIRMLRVLREENILKLLEKAKGNKSAIYGYVNLLNIVEGYHVL